MPLGRARDARSNSSTPQTCTEPHSTRDLIRQELTWRMGPEAAQHRLAMTRWSSRCWLLQVVGCGLVLSGVAASAVAIWITGATVYYLGGYCAYRSIVEMIRWRRAASKALGINIKFPNGTPAPPSKPERYLAWCESHNLHPYPFRPSSAGLS